jgi:hypothetical protein
VQDRLVRIDKICKLLDIKKLPDYNHFENAERFYKTLTKLFVNKNLESGIKLPKILASGAD